MTNNSAGDPKTTDQKMTDLRDRLQSIGSLIIAYSGGVDSAFLAAAATDVLGDRALAVTADSPSLAPSELREAVALAQQIGLNHRGHQDPGGGAGGLSGQYLQPLLLLQGRALHSPRRFRLDRRLRLGGQRDQHRRLGRLPSRPERGQRVRRHQPTSGGGASQGGDTRVVPRYGSAHMGQAAQACLSSRIPMATG